MLVPLPKAVRRHHDPLEFRVMDETGRPDPKTRWAQLVGTVRRRPLTCFILWFFTVGQAIAFVPVLLTASGRTTQAEPFIIAATWLGLVLPVLVIERIAEGPDATRRLLKETFRFRVPRGWYALALLVIPAGVLLVHLLAEPPPTATTADWLNAVTIGYVLNCVVVFLTVNWGEEVAWTGFVQRTLQSRGWAPMRAAAAGAPLFALGHISLIAGEGLQSGAAFMLLMLVLAVPFRALQAWVYNRTQSLALPGLLHAAGNAAAIGSIATSGMIPRLYSEDGQSVLVFCAIGLVVMAATRCRLGGAARARSRSTELETRS